MPALITLLTDFGLTDHYVAAMKGQILKRCADVRFVDISHAVEPGDIRHGAYLLAACRGDFPPGTIHLAVVDPGVGSDRLPLAVRADGQVFIGPDNGLFSLILEGAGSAEVLSIANTTLFNAHVATTFHGRDIFAPVAGALAAGYRFENLGPVVQQPVIAGFGRVNIEAERVSGRILHIDHFGNIVLNIRAGHLAQAGINERQCVVRITGREIRSFAETFVEAGATVSLMPGSSGYLEIGVQGESAARVLGCNAGSEVVISSM